MRRPSRKQRSPKGPDRSSKPGLVVGLGASAGGLEPLQVFFAALPSDVPVAFVVAQHLEPHRPSLLAELLGRHTAMPVAQAADGMRPEPGRVYVIAPGTRLTLEGSTFKVAPIDAADRGALIDTFFRSLAEDQSDRAVGALFSGVGHDGTAGLRAIKERGGLTLAQDPATATHDSMPQSAMDAGLVDHVLAPGEMAARLLDHAGYVSTVSSNEALALEAQIAKAVPSICATVRRHTGHDFAQYKEGTLVRRIRRRMQVVQVTDPPAYLERLKDDADEAESLVKDLLIGVTQFFRDPAAFDTLAQQVVPRLLQGKSPEAPLRIWVAGCASGEEAYSIAILVREHLDRVGESRFVQIFATDLDAPMLTEARQGRYPLSIAEHVSAERLARFFVRRRDGYHAAKVLRDMCIFSQHSIVRDPPFSQIDLISCRNVLIYMDAELQKRIAAVFHYALRPGAFLLLGPSEGLASTDLFEPVDKVHRVFRRRETVTRQAVTFPLSSHGAVRPLTTPETSATEPAPTMQQKITAAFERMALDEYIAPSAVVDARGEIVLVAGRLDRYFQLRAGSMTTNLVDIVPSALRAELRRAIDAVAASHRRVVRDNVPVDMDDGAHLVRLTVRPVPGVDRDAAMFAVVIQEHARLDPADESESASEVADQPALERLESELRTTRAELKATVENLESANEELKSSNEELISTNEELQSANEELQTSQEELRSLNEELETVNTELRERLDELATAHGDLQNLFASTRVATLFLDRELRIEKFTPAATALFNLIDSDVGRPITDLAPRVGGDDLADDSRQVLSSLNPVERQVQSVDGTGSSCESCRIARWTTGSRVS